MKKQPEPQNWPMTGIGRERRKHLHERIRACVLNRWDVRGQKDPPAVARARKLIEAHDAKVRASGDELYRVMHAAAQDVEGKILFAPDAAAALKAVEEFEAMAKRKGWTRAA